MSARQLTLPRFDVSIPVFGVLAVFGGILVGMFGPYAALPYFGIAALAISFAISVEWLVLLAWLIAAVFAGAVEYATGISQGFWVAYLLGLLLMLHAAIKGPMTRSSGASAATQAGPATRIGGTLPWIAAGWLATALFSTVIALPDLGQLLVAMKNYLFMWGVLLAIVWCHWKKEALGRFWTVVVVVACIQWPVALYQRFFVATKRNDAAAWDAVVGTFGGSPDGGGHSAAMALVCCIALGVVLSRWRDKRLSTISTLVVGLMCLASVMLAEVKMIFVWLPLVALTVFGSELRQNLGKSILMLCLATGLLSSMAVVYKEVFYGGPRTHSWEQVFDRQVKYAIDPDEYNVFQRRLGRVAALKFWWVQNEVSDPLHFFVGHGLAASRSSSSIAVGELARKYPFSIDFSSASTLLWDTGIVGSALFFLLLSVGAYAGIAQSKRANLSRDWRQGCFISGLSLLLLAAGFAYNRDSIDTPAIQILLFVALGQVLLARRVQDAVVR